MLALCPVRLSERAGLRNHAVRRERLRRDRRADRRSRRQGLLADRGGGGRGERARRDRLVLPGRGRPEGDHRRDASQLPAARRRPHRLRVLTVTNHFYSRTATLPGGRGIYPGLIAKSDVVGFDLYPLQEFCSNAWLPDVAHAQRELVRLAQGRPTFQWIEAQSWKCRQPALRVTPATVRAESWLSVAGGARGIGFFPGEWDPSVIPAVAADLERGGGDRRRPARAGLTCVGDGPVVVGARSFGGALYVIAVNPTRTAAHSTITAAGLVGPCRSACWRRGEASRRRATRSRTRSPRSACTSTSLHLPDTALSLFSGSAALLLEVRRALLALVLVCWRSGQRRGGGGTGSGDRLCVRRSRERGRGRGTARRGARRASPAGR